VNADVLESLAQQGIRHVALRSAGFNNVDLGAARDLGIIVTRVPAYSPHAVAEYTVALILSLSRRVHRAYTRVREGNFSLDGLLGFNLDGRAVGIIGTGKIGRVVAQILRGFGCRLIGYDLLPSEECLELGLEYMPMDQLLAESDVITIHCPLTPETFHLIDEDTVVRMKRGVMLINTSRGRVLDTQAVIDALKSGHIGSLGMDVYEEEEGVFFHDLSNEVIRDDTLSRLLTFPNVLITGHQAFFTQEAMTEIAEVTIQDLTTVEETGESPNEVIAGDVAS
jgi:D-lactate dehydrogenase